MVNDDDNYLPSSLPPSKQNITQGENEDLLYVILFICYSIYIILDDFKLLPNDWLRFVAKKDSSRDSTIKFFAPFAALQQLCNSSIGSAGTGQLAALEQLDW